MSELLWGIDLGGTKIECAVLRNKGSKYISPQENNQPEVLFRERIPTEGNHGYEHVLNQIKKLIDFASNEVGEKPSAIGFGTPGCIEPTTGMLRGSNSQHLNDKPVLNDLQELFGVPIKIENDANCFTLAEVKMGAVAQSFPNVKIAFGVILGTGVGGGIVISGLLLNGPNSITGEWGHNFLHESGGLCYCGKIGCVETILSGPALEKYYANLSNQHLSLQKIIELAETGDTAANQTKQRLLDFFGRGLANVINILDPDVIILGGGVGNINSLYSEGKQSVEKYLFSPNMQTEILKPKLGDSAGVFGAAFLHASLF